MRLGPLNLCVGIALSASAFAFDPAAAQRALTFSQQRLEQTAAKTAGDVAPKAGLPNGGWTTVPTTEPTGWTQGFFPGALWYEFEATGDPRWRTLADRWTRALEAQKTNTQTHDLGFKLFDSFGRAFEATKDPYYKGVLLTAAGSLASRYDAQVGVISCCDWNPTWRLPVVIDTMMNLELLLWGAHNGGDPAWQQMALSHALKTLDDLVRADGSTYQVADYDPASGGIRSRGTLQGYSNTSTWARGQAWAIYGFTTVYRYTQDPRMLQAAERTADYYLGRLCGNPVPKWDFDAPDSLRDSSSAAVVASALLELSGFVEDPVRKQRYRDAAQRMLEALTSSAYLAEGTRTPSVLLHGVGNKPDNQEVDVGLIYGDYYFLEALLRFMHPSSVDPGSNSGVPPLAAASDPGTPAGDPRTGCAGVPGPLAPLAAAVVLSALRGRRAKPRMSQVRCRRGGYRRDRYHRYQDPDRDQ